MTIYQQLESIWADKASNGYLAHFQADLTRIDRETLDKAKAGTQWLWILRECGTELFEVAAGRDAIWATYWLAQGNRRDTPSLVYLIEVASDGAACGTVKPISYDQAKELAAIPHPQGLRVKFSLS